MTNHAYRGRFARVAVRLFTVLALTGTPMAVDLASTAWASPPDNVWVEDIHLHPSGPAELDIAYDYIEPADDMPGGDIDRIALSTAIGFDRAPMDFHPTVGFVQFGDSSLHLDHIGLRARYRLAGTFAQPRIALAFGYRAILSGLEKHHQIETNIAGRYRAGRSGLAWDIGIRQQASRRAYDVEAHVSVAASSELLIDYMHIGVEAMALIPVKGDRVTDYGLGAERDGVAVYTGPTLRMHLEYFWLAGSVVTGAMYGDGAPYMVRVRIGTQF